jgi:hypothetical protein
MSSQNKDSARDAVAECRAFSARLDALLQELEEARRNVANECSAPPPPSDMRSRVRTTSADTERAPDTLMSNARK